MKETLIFALIHYTARTLLALKAVWDRHNEPIADDRVFWDLKQDDAGAPQP